MFRSSLAILSILISMPLFAGGMDSGGGELLKSSINPWYIENTEKVTYCIEVNSQWFDYDADKLDGFFRAAVDYWKNEFRPFLANFIVASQEFVRIDCNKAPDVKVQFGIVHPEQAVALSQPTEYVAAAIRTEYDEVNLRGKGFIYISPDRGPLRYKGEQYQDGVWSFGEGGRLYRVLLHELGHVFGLQHEGEFYQLMSAGYPEHLVEMENRPGTETGLGDQKEYFRFDMEATRAYCGKQVADHSRRFLGITKECVRVVFFSDRFEILEKNQTGPWDEVGTGTYRNIGEPEKSNGRTVWLYLTPQQVVIPYPLGIGYSHLNGPEGFNTVAWGEYVAKNGIRRQVGVELKPNDFVISGIDDEGQWDPFAFTMPETTDWKLRRLP
ncbi:MAG: matrixin family metalloprotease [Oligoflexales bacterium]